MPLSRIVGRKVAWDLRKSNQAKGDWWAPCPFHSEKTASFHVDDQKGFYYCFGCHAKGDAVGFLREAEGMGFLDAVAVLASEAGVPMPERSPREQAQTDRRAELVEVMDRALRWFRLQLQTGAGAAARDYLAGRGLDQAGQDRFEDMYVRLFETQAEWGEAQESRADLFRGFAEEIGLDMAAYDAAVADPATTERVELDFEEGQALGVSSTPTFFLDGELLELQEWDDLENAIQAAVNGGQ